MLTRCPQCATAFRVTPEQLKARQGRVRCGECQEVFNALDTLLETTAPAPAAAAPFLPVESVPVPTEAAESSAAIPVAEPTDSDRDHAADPAFPEPDISATDTAEPEALAAGDLIPEALVPEVLAPEVLAPEALAPEALAPEALAPEALAPEALAPEALETEALETEAWVPAPPVPDTLAPAAAPSSELPTMDYAEPVIGPDSTAPTDDYTRLLEPVLGETSAVALQQFVVAPRDTPPPLTDGFDAAPELEPLLHEEARKPLWPWLVGILVAASGLLAQAALHFRTELAVIYPATRPLLAAACEPLGCVVSLPRKPDQMAIESSDLHPDPAAKLLLTAILRNRAPFAQEYPHLELTLTDTADRPLLRRVLAPADYLLAKTGVTAGFAANSELAVNLAVDASDITAAGYRLYLFYP